MIARRLAIQILKNLKPIDALVEVTETRSTTGTPGKQLVEITGSRVNLRTGPSTETAALGSARAGEAFEYIKTEGDWYLVRMDEARQAYVSASFSRLTQAEEAVERSERIPPQRWDEVRKILGENKHAVDALSKIVRGSEQTFQQEFKNKKLDSGDPELWTATVSLMKLHKYESGVTGQFERFSELVGGGIIATGKAPVVAVPKSHAPASRMTIRGILRAGLGSNTAESKQGGTKIADADASRSELAADLTADLSPNDRLGISAGRTEEVNFAPVTRTHAGANYTRTLGEKTLVGARAGLRKFENENDDTANLDQSEFGVNASVRPSESFTADASFAVNGSSYPNNKDLDYKDTQYGIGAGGNAGTKARWRVRYAGTSHDADLAASTDDNTQNRLDGELAFSSGERSAIVVGAQSESYNFDQDSDPRSNGRFGMKLSFRGHGEPGNSREVSFEFRKKNFDVSGDRNFTEFRGEMRSAELSDSGGRRERHFFINYRNYKGDAAAGLFDYIEARSDFLRAPGNGFFWESNLYGQYFLRDNDVQPNALVTQFLWLGLIIGTNGAFQIGPHVATNTILVTTDSPDDWATFEHPNNTVRYGVKGAMSINAHALHIRGRGRYELLNYYNIDGAPTPSRLEIESNGTYDITPAIAASGTLKYYKTGSDDPNAIETSEFDILLGLIYRIGGGR